MSGKGDKRRLRDERYCTREQYAKRYNAIKGFKHKPKDAK